jgi:HAD superfamily hydrolase (TIGR01509 family)
MKYEAIIFDMDGTIIDTNDIWKQAVLCLIEDESNENNMLDQDDINKLLFKAHGLAIDKACKIIKDITKTDKSIQELIQKKTNIACSLYKEGIKFIEGFQDFFKSLKKYNIKTAIATNADEITLNLAKNILNLEDLFSKHIYNIKHVDNLAKPHPAIYLYTANQLDVDPERCISIEDSAHGIKAAKGAGMLSIGINTAKNRDLLKEADLIFDSYDDIDLSKII